MEYLVWAGGTLSILGMIGLVWCVVSVMRAKRKGLSDEELRAVLQSVLPKNLGALLLSVLGLMLVMVGLFLS
ncbi:hypothetical protein MHM88_11820 [Epibacterium sp. MM17-32]|jgi:hypothetical protein|uniref:hypothetical protein n=1 Tax=Epibacterium sp. MM17-32 TaxID=2917734 RepID=UPI001EF5A009|nr:hypothetical protein [Epibacterium sp. MM17-32]MCG7628494.1 hypothetical protein [Epibacterium sp. MM17-32]